MNRRAFLGWLAGTAAGVAAAPYLDLDKLLWVPGEKTIFIPPAPVLSTSVGLTRGDVFTIDGFFALNPITGLRTQHLQQFVITEDVVAGRPITMKQLHPAIYYPELPKGSKVQPLWAGNTIPIASKV